MNRRSSSKRKVKLPAKFNNHVINQGKQKKKKTDCVNNGESDEIRAEMYDLQGEGCDDGDRTEIGVFGSTNCCNTMDQPPNVSVPVNNCTDNDDIVSVHTVMSSDESNVNEDEYGTPGRYAYEKETAPSLNSDGTEVVVFDDEIVMKGCEKWKLTACGYFVWHKMGFYELSIEGISTLASGIGTPIMMDNTTAHMSQYGNGRADFARVLIEIHAKKEIRKGKLGVFGHTHDKCIVRPRKVEEITAKKRDVENMQKERMASGNDEFTQVQYRRHKSIQQRNTWNNKGNNGGQQKQEYRMKKSTNENKQTRETRDENSTAGSGKATTSNNRNNEGSKPTKNNTNSFEVLSTIEENTEVRMLKDRMVVDTYLKKKLQPTCTEASKWTQDMIRYFKDQWELDRLKETEQDKMNEEDVMENGGGIAQH
ncbi:hypothetical protein Tco_1357623 [Tanacetum coccineum]